MSNPPSARTAITPRRDEDFPEWYQQVIRAAELAEPSDVRGCMVIRPWGYGIWENMQRQLDAMFRATGHRNAYFPLFIPLSYFAKEAEHVEGFAKECAVVTHSRLEADADGKLRPASALTEPLVVRPTSETIIGHAYAKWVQSYRDLPILINLWNSVVRWEMRTKLFLRTLEFWWQEGHTAHATLEEAEAETRQMLDVYTDFAVNEAAIPVVPGRKSESERFAGANTTYSIEAMTGDTRALQAGTSHNLGQNFAKSFEIRYLDRNNELQYCWTTSWGLSTRFIGAIIMVHGDDQGLILPPRLAPFQVVIVPIFKSDEEKARVMEAARKIRAALVAADIRTKMDEREGVSPGFKFNDWEMRGVPLRLEIGPKDVAKDTVVLARRDKPGKEGKSFVPQEGLPSAVNKTLSEIQTALYERALAFREANTHDPKDYAEFKAAVETGFAFSFWCGSAKCEEQIKEETKATMRCIPLDRPGAEGRCICCGQPAKEKAIFGRAY